FAYDIVHIF
ncbi:hypothetical protein CFC21_013620, partial [Triticum aestivum]